MPNLPCYQYHILQLTLELMQLQRAKGHLEHLRMELGSTLLDETTQAEADRILLELEESRAQLNIGLADAGMDPESLGLLIEFLKDSEIRLPPHPHQGFVLQCGNEIALNMARRSVPTDGARRGTH